MLIYIHLYMYNACLHLSAVAYRVGVGRGGQGKNIPPMDNFWTPNTSSFGRGGGESRSGQARKVK